MACYLILCVSCFLCGCLATPLTLPFFNPVIFRLVSFFCLGLFCLAIGRSSCFLNQSLWQMFTVDKRIILQHGVMAKSREVKESSVSGLRSYILCLNKLGPVIHPHKLIKRVKLIVKREKGEKITKWKKEMYSILSYWERKRHQVNSPQSVSWATP